jgi:transposase
VLRLQPSFVKNEELFNPVFFKVVILSHIPFRLPGFEIQQVTFGESTLIVVAVARSSAAVCPTCSQSSRCIHSYYMRKPRGLPISGLSVYLHLHVRRFRCQNELCAHQTFSEQLPEVVAVSAQRTLPAHHDLEHLRGDTQRTTRFTSA